MFVSITLAKFSENSLYQLQDTKMNQTSDNSSLSQGNVGIWKKGIWKLDDFVEQRCLFGLLSPLLIFRSEKQVFILLKTLNFEGSNVVVE